VGIERRRRRCLNLRRALRHSRPHPRTRAPQLRERLLQRRRSERVQISRIDSYAAPQIDVSLWSSEKDARNLTILPSPSAGIRRCDTPLSRFAGSATSAFPRWCGRARASPADGPTISSRSIWPAGQSGKRPGSVIPSAMKRKAPFRAPSAVGGQDLNLRPSGYEPPRSCIRVPPYSGEMQVRGQSRPRPCI